MNPNARAQELITVSQSLIQVMTQETETLKAGNVAEIEPMQTQKAALTGLYESHLRGAAEDPAAFGAVEPEIRDQLAEITTQFQSVAAQNAVAVRAALDMNARLVQVIADAVVRGTPVAAGYTKTGAAPGGRSRGAAPAAPASLNQSL
jgi:flagellar biosynthesis/type III secretory pathway chaperone